jgi:methylmalonyl-CoA mutase C-terminal domain/subunit
VTEHAIGDPNSSVSAVEAAGPVLRVVLGKVGLDTHDRGIKLVAVWLRDAGMEVVYLGPYLEAAGVARAAMEEDADVVGVSFLDGGHLGWSADLLAELRDQQIAEVPLVVGGTIPDADRDALLEMGVAAVFRAGHGLADIVSEIRGLGIRKRSLVG